MFDFIQSYKLKNTYRVNSILYTLKHTPLIKKVIPYSLYNNKKLKLFINILSFIIEFISIFIWKALYLILLVYLTSSLYKNNTLAFINIITFLTIIGGFLNTNIFNPSLDKYYAIVLMRFDAKKYVLVNYVYFLIKCFIGFLPFTIILGLMNKLSLTTCLLIPVFVVIIKNIFNMFTLISYKDSSKIKNENKLVLPIIIGVIVLLALAYGMPYFEIGITESIFKICALIAFIISIYSFIYIIRYDNYNLVCKELLKREDLVCVEDDKTFKNQISNDLIKESNKTGYAYLNDLFVQRHKKLLTKASKRISITLVVLFLVLSILLFIFPNKNKEVNDILKNSIPYFMFIMYFINRGQKICETMFRNCDHSMLTYRFYRQSNAVLSLFKERLKVLIKLNIIPGIIMAVGTILMLYITDGTSIIGYIVTFLTIISMSIFFSIHYLVLYYLFQPYDINMDIKNPLFKTICGLTYAVCYMFSQVQIPTMVFGIIMIVFTIIYSVLSLILVYRYAPVKFKLRIE